MNFFEQELRKFFEKNNGFDRVNFIGKASYGTLGERTRMKLEFVTLGTHQKYEGIKATVLDKTDGMIDSLVLKFVDIYAVKDSFVKAGGQCKLVLTRYVENGHMVMNRPAEWMNYMDGYLDSIGLSGN